MSKTVAFGASTGNTKTSEDPVVELQTLITAAMANTTGGLADFAEELGVSYHTVWSWKAGRRTPGTESVHRLADAFERRGSELRGLASVLRQTAGQR